jgi:hypothetical protein
MSQPWPDWPPIRVLVWTFLLAALLRLWIGCAYHH